jgi:hypothetical protein
VFEYRSRSRVAVGMETPAFYGKTVLTMVMRAEHLLDIHVSSDNPEPGNEIVVMSCGVSRLYLCTIYKTFTPRLFSIDLTFRIYMPDSLRMQWNASQLPSMLTYQRP